jgi:hypothetical protein
MRFGRLARREENLQSVEALAVSLRDLLCAQQGEDALEQRERYLAREQPLGRVGVGGLARVALLRVLQQRSSATSPPRFAARALASSLAS